MSDLKELDVQDKKGNVVISPDLKVRHKDSQYEYTVDSVIKDDEGETVVLLRLPEEPRITPDEQTASPKLVRDLSSEKVLYEIDPNVSVYEPEDTESVESDDDLLAVPSEEFEKEYEVK
mgnify:CR=1 FL=1|tara:strand:+ start:754 stop:1110 length:357 start_codon:yes stop_codon:yes gene_type:complete